ncbi:MAG: carbohydrate binding domain-containing protein [Cytophagaceae bacterium]|nr:carbohydrate binding domain-containing protein [Cytophagaceae bacterium]
MIKGIWSSIIFLFFADLSAQNLISNGDFESGAMGWSNMAGNGGAATFTNPVSGAGNIYAGINAMRSNVTAPGANAWDVQTIHSGFTALPGTAHTLNFWAKASVAGRQMRIVIQNTTYAAQDYTLTTAWTQYAFVFTPTESSLQLKIHYTQSGDFYFDDFVIIDPSGGPSPVTSVINASTKYQDMVGFGGALTWYAERINLNSNKAALYDFMFTDLGLDILRLKNWYYPLNYPASKSAATMDPSWYKASFDITNDIYTQAKTRNANIDVLLCSWSPPKALKSNNAIEQGTLNKSGGQFMYKEFAQYWVDMLDRITFVPDYISIQNEPGFVNPGWETCEWRPIETATFPGYDRALDSVWNRIKTRPVVPKILGPEPENLGTALWDPTKNTFRDMATPLKNKSYLYGYNYHLYNYAGGAGSISPANLNIIRDEFGNHPNFMTEFSSTNYNWIDVARMVHANLVEANTSAYIYWELIWDNASSSAMIGIDASGNYTVKDNYYSIKHYAKYIDKGYKRIAMSGSNATLNVTAFLHPAGNQVTVVAINDHVSMQPLNITLASGTISSAQAYRSVVGNYWQTLGAVNLATTQNLPGKSITTFVISTSVLPVDLLHFKGSREGNNALLNWATASEHDNNYFEILHSEDAITFEPIGRVEGKGNSNVLQQYDFLHAGIGNAAHYYQLKQVDYSGASMFSPVIVVEANNFMEEPVLSPNPFDNNLILNIDVSCLGSQISICNMLGDIIYEGVADSAIINLSTPEYPPGLYMISLKCATSSVMLKAIKQSYQ